MERTTTPMTPLTPRAPIDRRALVSRADVRVSSIDTGAFLSVGNGETAFTADVTGLQTLNATYTFPPLQTQTHADWGWHVTPPPSGVDPAKFVETPITARGHTARYPVTADGQVGEYNWLRANPHRLSLLRLFLRRDPAAAQPPISAADVTAIDQTLHLWNGTLRSSFTLDGTTAVSVVTAVHPRLDAVGTRVCSAALRSRRLGLGLAFPYASLDFHGGAYWGSDADGLHVSELVSSSSSGSGGGGGACDAAPVLRHTLDNSTSYYVHLALGGGGCLAAGKVPHDWLVFANSSATATVEEAEAEEDDGDDEACLELTAWLSPNRVEQRAPPSASEVIAAAAAHWPGEWARGAALELSGSAARGAAALEARVVRSQWIAMSQEAGSNPPQETGLMTNSWFGKFHGEMRWIHQAHHLLWGRGDLALRSERYYDAVREQARRHTRVAQNYSGVRWPKMVGPPQLMPMIGDAIAGKGGAPLYDGPSGAGPWIVWEQPHPIIFAELAYRAAPTAATAARHNRTVHDTADFLADYILAPEPPPEAPRSQPGAACWPLGPPLFTAEVESNEGRAANDTASTNPTFELVYWRFGLMLAAGWRRRLGLLPVAAWETALARLCKPTTRPLYGEAGAPQVYYPYPASSDGYLVSNGVAPQLFAAAYAPATDDETFGVDAAAMRDTFAAVFPSGVRNVSWGSDACLYAMVAARLGNASLAASILADPDATWTAKFLPNGQYAMPGFLPAYTPTNGALLSAVAFLAAGWDGDGGRAAPGFPSDGSWTVRSEGFRKYF